MDDNDDAAIDYDEFCKLVVALKEGQVPGVPTIDVIELISKMASEQGIKLPSAALMTAGQPVELSAMKDTAAETVVREKTQAKMRVNNTAVATACSAFSTRPEVSVNASATPFEDGETGGGAFGDDDGIRVRLEFTVNFMIHLGTYVNGVYF